MEKVVVLLSNADTESHFGAICESTKFDFGRGLAYFDQIHTLPGPHQKIIFLRQSHEDRNSKSIGRVLILPVPNNNTMLTFVTETPNANFEEFALLVKRYFRDLNLLEDKKSTEPMLLAATNPELPTPHPKQEKLTLRQVDSLVQQLLGSWVIFSYERREGGQMILYDVWKKNELGKTPIGTYRVFEHWKDGSGQCGWQPGWQINRNPNDEIYDLQVKFDSAIIYTIIHANVEKAYSTTQSMPTNTTKLEPTTPTTQVTNVNINVQGNIEGHIIVGDDNKIEH